MRCSSQDLCSQTRGNHIICGVTSSAASNLNPSVLNTPTAMATWNHMRHVLRFRVSLSPQTPGCGCSTGPAQNHSRYSENRCSAAKMPNNLDSGHCKACHKCSHFQNQEVMQKRPKSAFDDVAYVKNYFSLLSPLESYLDLRRMHLQPAAKKSGPWWWSWMPEESATLKHWMKSCKDVSMWRGRQVQKRHVGLGKQAEYFACWCWSRFIASRRTNVASIPLHFFQCFPLVCTLLPPRPPWSTHTTSPLILQKTPSTYQI